MTGTEFYAVGLDATGAPAAVRVSLPVPLVDAARATGYSADYLGRLVKQGRLRNHGRKFAPRVRLDECPRKPVPLGHAIANQLDDRGEGR